MDADDVAKTGQEIAATLSALGIANYNQAARILSFALQKSVQGNTTAEFQTSVKVLGLLPGDIISVTYLKEGFERQPFRILKIAPGSNYRSATITAQIHLDDWYSDDTNSGSTGGRRLPGYGIGLPRPIEGTTLDANGDLQFDVTESSAEAPDGTTTLLASVGFVTPGAITDSAPGIPFVSLVATVATTGGTLKGGQILYYALSSVDVHESEGALSFVVMADIPAGADTNGVTLTGLSFPTSATKFHAYRGPNPIQLFRISSDVTLSAEFTDSGMPEQAVLPPDPNFDHVNFYWRLELQPEAVVTTQSASTVGNGSLAMIANEYRGATVRLTRGKGESQERTVIANDAATLTINPAWDIIPDSTSSFVVAQSGYQFGATGKTNRLQFEIPNRTGATVQLSGRSANGKNVECPYEISPLTRWQIGGAGNQVDAAVPGEPVFGVGASAAQGGCVLLAAIGFTDLTNTITITAGTYTFYYYNEALGPPTISLALPAAAADSTITLSASSTAEGSSYIQFEREVLQVTTISTDGLTLQVTRGLLGSAAADHLAGALIYVLKSHVTIVPFIRNFFGSPASGSWSYLLPLPNVRIASAQLFVTNSQGNSPVAVGCLTNNLDSGLRTLSGGQYSFQVAGFLGIQAGAAPDIWIEAQRVIRDVFAIVSQPASNPIQLNVNLNGALLCSLSFSANSNSSNSVSGLALPALNAGDRISLDIVSVGQTTPGSDLTVIIRV